MFGLSSEIVVTRPTIIWRLLSSVIAMYTVAVFASLHSCIPASLLGRLLLASDLTHHRM